MESESAEAKKPDGETQDSVPHVEGRPVVPMLDWLEKQGAAGLDKLGVARACGKGDLGVFAKEKIEPGSVIAHVPQSCILSAEKARASDIGKACLAALPSGEAIDELILRLWLMAGRADTSHEMHTYLRSLPAETPTPMGWPRNLQMMLAGTNLSILVSETLERLQKQHASAMPTLRAARPDLFGNDDDERFGFDAFLWAHGMWYSRRYPTALAAAGKGADYTYSQSTTDEIEEESDGEGAVIPFFDLFNHRDGAQVEWKANSQSVSFVSRASCDIEAGVQVFNNYGEKSNEDLMLYQGFALLDNMFDTYSLWITVQAEPEQAMAKTKTKKGRKARRTEPSYHRLGPFLILRKNDKWDQFPAELWQALADPAAAVAKSASPGAEDKAAPTGPIQVPPEHVSACLAMLQQKLQGFVETKTRDRHFAAGGAAEGQELDMRIRYIACYRDGQRQVLEEAVQALEAMLASAAPGGDEEDEAQEDAEEEEGDEEADDAQEEAK
eukprot:TRINITY_DN57930_c0_g1_i1.p1 TRINITY_DN57930_c0_g1~~TRINITY_DN57930_c0_g1_i1.p1  ORF type:complete len:498 (+),score=116.82 TRINITY_DN57930_c0_g1_i1:105-1598(+)